MRELLPQKIYIDYVISAKYYNPSYQRFLKPLNFMFYVLLFPLIKKIKR